MPFSVNRPLVAQQWSTYGVSVGVAPAQPLLPQLQITSLIDSFAITVPAAAANSIIIGGNAGIVAGPPPTGLELIAGTTVQFIIQHDGRQAYELQAPLIEIAKAVKCTIVQAEAEPFIVWDMSQIYVVAVAATSISVAVFPAMFV